MGDDVAALIGHLKLGKADVMGYSWDPSSRCRPPSAIRTWSTGSCSWPRG
jgi:hypothetical protein